MVKRNYVAIVTLAVAWLVPVIVTAQVERYELGKRLRRFEDAWQSATEDKRRESAKPMIDAVNSFFGMRLQAATAKLDEAWLVAENPSLTDWQRAIIPYRIRLSKMVVGVGESQIDISLVPYYKNAGDVPNDAQVRFELKNSAGGSVCQVTETWQNAVAGIRWSLAEVASGDYVVTATVIFEGLEWKLLTSSLSIIDDLDGRLASLEQKVAEVRERLSDSIYATARDRINLMNRAKGDSVQETDFPFDMLLKETEELATAESPERILATTARVGDHWMVLAEKRRQVAVRFRAPKEVSGPLPVLFLMHGAGGSENMFFETYGSGRAVELGIERGWLVVAPRQGLGGLSLDCAEMLDLLEGLFEIDRSQVYLLGHSMGAAQVIRQVTLHPGLPKAASAIGGGRPIRTPATIKDVPWFVAAGSLDFGRGGAKAFYESLRDAGAKAAKYEEYDGVEHMVIVQAALDDAFAFFDQVQNSEQ